MDVNEELKYVNEELKFLGKFTQKKFGGGGRQGEFERRIEVFIMEMSPCENDPLKPVLI